MHAAGDFRRGAGLWRRLSIAVVLAVAAGLTGSVAVGAPVVSAAVRPHTAVALPRAETISARWNDTCVIRADGTLACWGANASGVSSPPSGTFVAVSVGGGQNSEPSPIGFACAIRTDGTLACWGYNGGGQATPPAGTFVAVSAGYRHACAIRSDGTVACWGTTSMAHETTPPAGTFVALSTDTYLTCALATDGTITCRGLDGAAATPPSGTFTALDSSGGHSCAIRTDGSAACWGYNGHGEATPPTGPFVAISTGGSHSCGVRPDGGIACWGANSSGQSTPPTDSFLAVTGGAAHGCAIGFDGAVSCWGANDYGQTNAPTVVARRRTVAAGTNHTCATTESGTMACWGDNSYGQANPAPYTAFGVTAGVNHSCALLETGWLYCWGANTYGQANAPMGSFVAISAGGSHSCGLRTDGTISCWGYNNYGQSSPPTGSYRAVSAGLYHTCALAPDGTATCWGMNNQGQASAPGGTFVAVSSGGYHTCAIQTDRTIVCWGGNTYGQLTAPSGAFVSVSSGQYHSCALRVDGVLVCWGRNDWGQAAAPAGSYVSVSAGAYHTCAVAVDDTVSCWGYNTYAQSTVPVPGAPAYPSAEPGTGSATVSWSAPWNAIGTPILSYTVTSWPGGRTCTATGTSCTITGLTNGTQYSFTVVAYNGFNSSDASIASAAITVGAPGRPPGVTAYPGDGWALVSWLPAPPNAADVLGYSVVSDPDGRTCTSARLSCVVTGLTNGTYYTFTVTAGNYVGWGPASLPSDEVAPSGVPDPPTGVTATAGNGSATVSWTAPASDGGAPISGYAVTSYPGGLGCTTTGATFCGVSGLTNGVSYTFKVTASNARGTGVASDPSAPVTPATIPGAPSAVVATAGDGLAIVSWSAGASNGSPISLYTVTSSPGGRTCTTSISTSCTVSGLTNYTPYTFTVQATNGRGIGPASGASSPVTPMAAAGSFTVASDGVVTAGKSFMLTVTARDVHGATASGYRGTIVFTSSDPGASLPGPYTFTAADAGVHTFTVTLTTAAAESITATDVSNRSITGSRMRILVAPDDATTLLVTSTTSWVAGSAQSVTVTARDAYGNVAMGYTGTVHFTSSDAAAVLPADYAFTSDDMGIHVFTATLRTAGTRSIGASDTVTTSIAGSQAGIVVRAGSVVSLLVKTATTWDAGVTHSLYVTARDAYGNTVTAYRGTVHLTSTDPAAVLPADYAFTATDRGVHRFTITLRTAGTRSVTATDTATASITGSQAGIAVRPAPVRSFIVVTATSWTAGSGHSLYVTVNDPYGNRVTNYAGTVHFTSTDPAAVLPADYTFTATDHGYHVFTVSLRTAGSRAVVVTDYAGITGAQLGISVTPGAAKSFAISAPTTWPAGTAQSVTATARDAYGNTATGYHGTVHFTSTDGAAVLPANYAFTGADAGVHTFTVTLVTPGAQSITATDTGSATITGSATGIGVS